VKSGFSEIASRTMVEFPSDGLGLVKCALSVLSRRRR
jgi:hypothetical protein